MFRVKCLYIRVRIWVRIRVSFPSKLGGWYEDVLERDVRVIDQVTTSVVWAMNR